MIAVLNMPPAWLRSSMVGPAGLEPATKPL